MRRCLEINFSVDDVSSPVEKFLKENARGLELEGTAKIFDSNLIRVFVCGVKEKVDQFLDMIYSDITGVAPQEVEVVPLAHDTDYRGVFRVIIQ